MQAEPAVGRRRIGWTPLLAALIAIGTVSLLATTVVAANFAPGVGWTVLLMAVPLTIGLPTTLATLGCVMLLSGPPLWAFGLMSVVLGFCCQLFAMRIVQRFWRRRR